MILLSHVLTALAGALRVSSCLLLLSGVSAKTAPKEPAGRARPILFCTLAAFVLCLILGYLPVPVLIQAAAEAACILPCACLGWKINLRLSLFFAVFGEIAFHLWTALSTYGLAALFQNQQFLLDHTLRGSLATLLPACLSFMGLMVAPLLWPKVADHGYRIFTGLFILTLFATIQLRSLTSFKPDEEACSTYVYLAALLLICLLVYQLRRQYETEHELAQLKDLQAEMIRREYGSLRDAYSMNARLFHDFRNHLGALRNLMQSGQYDKARQYVDDLAGPASFSIKRRTGDDTIDYLIGSKEETAASYEIQFDAEVEFPQNAPFRSADLCSILGNLLDNAIEAAKKVPDASGRFIRLTIRRVNLMVMIRVENSFTETLLFEKGILRTTKKDGGLHGLGIGSARAAAEKYDGTLQTGTEGNTFRAVATLSIQGQKTTV